MANYREPGRLADIITLISVLASDNAHVITVTDLEGTHTKKKPKAKSAKKDWLNIIKDHPEFFRYDDTQNCVALWVRYYNEQDLVSGIVRKLSAGETQELINIALGLFDKESTKFANTTSIATVIVSFLSVVVTLIVAVVSDKETSKKLEEIKTIITNTPSSKSIINPSRINSIIIPGLTPID